MNNNTETSKNITETGETNIRFRRTLETKPIEMPESENPTANNTPAPEPTNTATDFKDVSWRPNKNWESLRGITDTILNLSAGMMVRTDNNGIKNTDDATDEFLLFLNCLEKDNAYDNISALKDYLYTWTTDFRKSHERYENQLKAKLNE
ncbi:MAG TPA: hypothetical protein VF644_10410 [Pyrinomonadaceae bacterium]